MAEEPITDLELIEPDPTPAPDDGDPPPPPPALPPALNEEDADREALERVMRKYPQVFMRNDPSPQPPEPVSAFASDDPDWVNDPAQVVQRFQRAIEDATTKSRAETLALLAPVLRAHAASNVSLGLPEEAQQYVREIAEDLGVDLYAVMNDPKAVAFVKDAAYGRAVKNGKISVAPANDSEPIGGGPSNGANLSRDARVAAENYYRQTGRKLTRQQLKEFGY